MGIKYVAFDVETPNRCNDRISSIGISIIDDEGNIETREYLVNPECDFDPFNISLTGISPYTVSNAPTFPLIWDIVEPLFMQNTLAAHNARFDLSVLTKTLSAYRISVPSFRYLCTMQMTRDIHLPVENNKLPTLCNYFGIPLNHHSAGSDSRACAIILMGLVEAGIDVKGYIDIYDRHLYEDYKPHSSWRSVHSESTLALNELSAIVRAISCDGVLTVEEINYLIDWMNNNDALKGNFPYDRIYNKLAEVLEDGVITQQEHDELIELFQTAENPVDAVSCECGCLDVSGKTICLSGEFDYGKKDKVSALLVDMGAVVMDSVTKKTNILVVGGQGNSSWSAGNYGSKIKKALELQSKGSDIMIIREADFFKSIGG